MMQMVRPRLWPDSTPLADCRKDLFRDLQSSGRRAHGKVPYHAVGKVVSITAYSSSIVATNSTLWHPSQTMETIFPERIGG